MVTVPDCPEEECTATLTATDVYCPQHDSSLLFQGRPSWPRMVLVNLTRGAVVGAFLAAAWWDVAWPLYAAAVVVGLLVVVAPLRAHRAARLVAAVSWVAIAAAYLPVATGVAPPDVTTAAVTGTLAVTLAATLYYAWRSSRHLAVPQEAEGDRSLAVVGVSWSLLSGAAILSALAVLSTPALQAVVVPLPPEVPAWGFRLVVASILAVPVMAATVGFLRSGRGDPRPVHPPFGGLDPPRSDGRPSTVPPEAVRGASSIMRRVVLSLTYRVKMVATSLLHGARNFGRRVRYHTSRVVRLAVNAIHFVAVRTARRIAAAARETWGIVHEGGVVALHAARRYARGVVVPLAGLAVAAVAAYACADAVRAYLVGGRLTLVAVALASGGAALLALSASWIALSGEDARVAAGSLLRSASVAIPRAFVLFVVAAWAVGLAGLLGYSPITPGPVTFAASALLVLAFFTPSEEVPGEQVEAAGRKPLARAIRRLFRMQRKVADL